MTTKSQKRKAVAELNFGDFEASVAEKNPPEHLIASSSKSPRIQPENLNEIKTSLRKEIMSHLAKMLAENQNEVLKKLIAPLNKSQQVRLNNQDSDSVPENTSVARRSMPGKTNATSSKTTPVIVLTIIVQEACQHYQVNQDFTLEHQVALKKLYPHLKTFEELAALCREDVRNEPHFMCLF